MAIIVVTHIYSVISFEKRIEGIQNEMNKKRY